MGDPKATSSSPSSPYSSFSLPPGCRFYPSEEQLLCYYLHHKNNTTTTTIANNNNNNIDSNSALQHYNTIKEVDLYNFNPFELPEITCFCFGYRGRKRHWYCYTEIINGGEKEQRRAGFGFWKRKGRVRDVMGSGGKVILGRRKCFIFYLEKSDGKKSVRTDWFMYEYALIDNLKVKHMVVIMLMRRLLLSQ